MRKGIACIVPVLLASLMAVAAPAARAYDGSPFGVMHYGSVAYLTGGVGLDERAALDREGRDYNLKLSFAMTGGKYVGGVRVVVRDASGGVALDAVSDGPWVFVRLPAGRYGVSATFGGATQTRTVELSPSRQTVVNLFWKDAD